MGFSNPIIGGGGALVYTSIKSPNFMTGLLGWIIRKDGSAEFNNLTIRGTFAGTDFIINSLGAFFYTSTPALGNLIASITPAAGANDGLGNAFKAGITIYGAAPSGGTMRFIELLAGSPPTQLISTGDVSETLPAKILTGIQNLGASNVQLVTQILAPENSLAVISGAQFNSPAADNTSGASSNLICGGSTLVVGQTTGNKFTFELEGNINNSAANGIFDFYSGLDNFRLIAAILNAFDPAGSGAREVPHSMVNANSWTAGPLQYMLMPDNTVWVDGEITAPAAVGNPSNVNVALAAAYRPSQTRQLVAVEDSNAAHLGQSLICEMQTSGLIRVFDATATQGVRIFGRYPLS